MTIHAQCICALILFTCTSAPPPSLAGPPEPADFYVAPWGDDADPGSFDKPFATLTRARGAVRTLIAAGLTAPVTVLVRDGTYRITDPIILSPLDSGTAAHSITYAAYPNERPVVSGGRAISGWTAQPDGTWTVDIPEAVGGAWPFRELFVDGQRRPRARHPNSGFNRVSFAEPDQRTAIELYEGDLPLSTNLAGAELVFLHDWSISRVRIDQVDHAQNILTTAEPIGAAVFIFAITFFEEHPRYFVENDLALLDAPGEWHLDTATGRLTYRPMPGEQIASIESIAPLIDELLVVRGDFGDDVNPATEQSVTNVHFDGISFEHCEWQLPNGGFAEFQAGFYEWRDTSVPYEFPSAVTFEQVENCSFVNGRVSRVGGWGLMFGRAASQCSVIGNVFTDIAGNGALIGEDRFRNIPGGLWWVVRPDQAASGNIFENNLVEECGKVFLGCVGLWVGLANDTLIDHNLLRFLPQTGISVGNKFDETPTPCFGNSITKNHIHDVMLTLSDGGAIYTVGLQPGTVIDGNLMHSIPPNVGAASSVGVFIDEGSASIKIKQNAFHSIAKSPMKFHIAGVNTVSSNVLLLPNAGVEPFLYFNMDPANIVLSMNDISVVNSPVTCDHSVYDTHFDAGLEQRYLDTLIEPPVQDGCASCAGVPYSGLTLNACSQCNEPEQSCTVPTVSQWGMVTLAALLLIAGTRAAKTACVSANANA